jgi:hypothetical protein
MIKTNMELVIPWETIRQIFFPLCFSFELRY